MKSRPDRSLRWAILALALLGLFYLAVAVRMPLAVGLWQDDATYVATAQSLARGHGYRHDQMPSQPLQTRYPALYPAFLSLAVLVNPEYPTNLPLLLLPGVLAAVGLLGLSLRYWREVFSPPTALLWLAGGLAAFSPAVLAFVRYTMSDLVYACLSIAALVCLDATAPRAQSRAAQIGWLGLGAALAALALLTRSIGVTLAVAVVVTPLLRRRFSDAALALAVLVILAGPWWLWQWWAAAQNGPLQTAVLEAPELSYGLWAPQTVEQSLRVIQQNFFRATYSLSFYQLALPIGPVREALATPSWRTGLLHLGCYLVSAATLIGFLVSLRRGLRTLHLYALIYAAAVIAWPFEPHRFLIPWTPFLLYFLLTGVLTSVRGCAAGLDRRTAAGAPPLGRRLATSCTALLALALAVLFAFEGARILGSRADRYFLRELPQDLDLGEADELYRWILLNTLPSAVFASAWSAGLFLNTHRRGYFSWPDSDPYLRYYGSDRQFFDFYTSRSPSEIKAVYDEMRAEIVQTYSEAGIEYYVDQPHWLEARVLAHIIETNPQRFERLFESSKGSFRVYRLHFPEP